MGIRRKRNISVFSHCYGCGVCSASCPKNAITIKMDDLGFLRPVVHDNCVDCGICLDVCSFSHQGVCVPKDRISPLSAAAWSRDIDVRLRCTSGGVAYEIERYLLKQGYEIVAVRYDKEARKAEHYIASDEVALLESIGSKYIQSHTEFAFSQLSKNKKYLVVGTPCQIDSLRRYIKRQKCEENFILIDFFCHSVPSWYMWNSYLDMVGIKDLDTVQFRSKRNGWQNSTTIYLKGDGKEWLSPLSNGDLFYWFFLGDRCPNPACVKDCKFKQQFSAADIRIGDLWGYKYLNNQEGVSALVAFTDRGKQVVYSLENCDREPCDFATVAELQMKRNANTKVSYKFVLHALRDEWHLKQIYYFAFLIEFPFWIMSKIEYCYRLIYSKYLNE